LGATYGIDVAEVFPDNTFVSFVGCAMNSDHPSVKVYATHVEICDYNNQASISKGGIYIELKSSLNCRPYSRHTGWDATFASCNQTMSLHVFLGVLTLVHSIYRLGNNARVQQKTLCWTSSLLLLPLLSFIL